MSSKHKKTVDDALGSMRDIVEQSRKRYGRSRTGAVGSRSKRPGRRSVKQSVTRFGGYLVAILVAILLPFFLLIRVATSLYVDSSINHWIALGCGMAAAGVVLLLYAQFVAARIGMGRFVANGAGRFVAVLLLAYCSYGLLYLSASNAKTENVASTYTALHPIIRIAMSTWLLVDRNAILTDTERNVDDYRSMGLSPMERSLHYRQVDGYAHAVDLRTIGRSEIRNRIMSGYFRALGFTTLRHIGTADHLHVSLPINR